MRNKYGKRILEWEMNMKYWKEKENNPLENMQFWTGTYISKLAENEMFLYGSNPLLSFC